MNVAATGSWLNLEAAIWIGLLGDMILKGTLLLGLGFSLTRLTRRWSARCHSRIWTGVFVLLALLPLSSLVSSVFVAENQAQPWLFNPTALTIVQTHNRPQNTLPEADRPHAPTAHEIQTDATATPTTSSVSSWRPIAALWLTGALTLLTRLLIRLHRTHRSQQQTLPLNSPHIHETVNALAKQMGLTRPIKIRVAAALHTPLVSGWRQPVLILPEAILQWPNQHLDPILRHELAHIQRADLWRILLTNLVCALHWFHPLAWIAGRRARLALEMACDDVACGDRIPISDYARQLLWFATRPAAPAPSLETAGLARKTSLESRLHYLVGMRSRSGPGTRLAAVLVGLTALLLPVRFLAIQTAGLPPTTVTETIVNSPVDQWHEAGDSDSALDLLHAADTGNRTQVALILDKQPGLLNTQDHNGMTPLALAAWNDHLGLVDDLLKRGADPDIKNNNQLTPLFCAVDRGRGQMPKLLLSGGANALTTGYQNSTLLHMAARVGNDQLLAQLIATGCDVNAINAEGYTPLDMAQAHNKTTAAKRLQNAKGQPSGRPLPMRPMRKLFS